MTPKEQFIKLIDNYYIRTLSQIDNNYKTATNHNDELLLEQLYKEITKEKLDRWSCQSCALSNWKRFKKLYLELKNDETKNTKRASQRRSNKRAD